MRDAGPQDRPTTRPTVAIVGGGAAGVLVAIHLLRESEGRLRPLLIETRAALGEGIAYGTRQSLHLLNVRAGNMSAFGDLPGDFVGHVEAGLAPADADAVPVAQRYLPRHLFAGYLRATLARFAPIAEMHVRDRVVDVEAGDSFQLRLASGATAEADAVVLATGNAPRPPVFAFPGLLHAWDDVALASIAPGETVAIVGSGLSMVDAAVALVANGHRARIDVFSRHGLLPLPHHDTGGPHGDAGALHGMGVRARLRALRGEAAALAAEGKPWQWLMDRLRPHGRALWQSLPPAEQGRFLRHAVRYWDIHRHRIAPGVAAHLQGMLRCGQLRIHAARVLGMDAAAPGARLYYRARGSATDASLAVDRIIDATGIESRPAALPGSLLATLVDKGVAMPGPHGLGIAVDAEGAVRSADGASRDRLYAIGTPRLGVEWETTAIPDLRVQAETIARRLARDAR